MIAKVMLLSSAAVAALCVFTPVRAETVDYNAKYGVTDVPGICSYADTDKKDYTGHKITILTHAVPVMGEPVELHSKQFEE
ncbi:MAG: ABC transporter substrate-binding protein, partial [Alphaproteobacteria bacterium]|nr:ABC transporter substrate-binding protein [Alphaproteobacteria bacterium]